LQWTVQELQELSQFNLPYKHDFDVDASWVYLPQVMESHHVMALVAWLSEN